MLAAIAQWIRLRLPLWFKSQAQHLCFHSQISYYFCHCVEKRTKIRGLVWYILKKYLEHNSKYIFSFPRWRVRLTSTRSTWRTWRCRKWSWIRTRRSQPDESPLQWPEQGRLNFRKSWSRRTRELLNSSKWIRKHNLAVRVDTKQCDHIGRFIGLWANLYNN